MLSREQFQEVVESLELAAPFEAWLVPSRAFVLVSLLQLALRHPSIGDFPEANEIGRNMAINLIKKLGEINPLIEEGLNQGWSEEFDISRETFDRLYGDSQQQTAQSQALEEVCRQMSDHLPVVTRILEIHTLVLIEAIEMLANITRTSERECMKACVEPALEKLVSDAQDARQRFDRISVELGELWNLSVAQLPKQ